MVVVGSSVVRGMLVRQLHGQDGVRDRRKAGRVEIQRSAKPWEKSPHQFESDAFLQKMTRQQVFQVAAQLIEIANILDWKMDEVVTASTGTIYIELTRRQGRHKEWVVIRVANHKQVFFHWMTTYSWSPYEYDDDMIFEVLMRPFGKTGDVFEVD